MNLKLGTGEHLNILICLNHVAIRSSPNYFII